eukprot:6418347-Amphidinium_carterae.4
MTVSESLKELDTEMETQAPAGVEHTAKSRWQHDEGQEYLQFEQINSCSSCRLMQVWRAAWHAAQNGVKSRGMTRKIKSCLSCMGHQTMWALHPMAKMKCGFMIILPWDFHKPKARWIILGHQDPTALDLKEEHPHYPPGCQHILVYCCFQTMGSASGRFGRSISAERPMYS